MGVKFHPTAELELIDRVRAARQARREAAVAALTCLRRGAADSCGARGGAGATAGAKPKRDTNYAPPATGAVALGGDGAEVEGGAAEGAAAAGSGGDGAATGAQAGVIGSIPASATGCMLMAALSGVTSGICSRLRCAR